MYKGKDISDLRSLSSATAYLSKYAPRLQNVCSNAVAGYSKIRMQRHNYEMIQSKKQEVAAERASDSLRSILKFPRKEKACVDWAHSVFFHQQVLLVYREST